MDPAEFPLLRRRRGEYHPKERMIQLAWHATNLENGVARVVDSASIAYLKGADDLDLKWPSSIDCVVMGQPKYSAQLTQIIPRREGPIRAVSRWLRSTGTIPSDVEAADDTKDSLKYLINIEQSLGELMEPLNGGVIFLTTLQETYALIELGERNLCEEAGRTPGIETFKKWTSPSLAKGWEKKIDLGSRGSVDVFECLMFYNHTERGKDKGSSQYQEYPQDLRIERQLIISEAGKEDKEIYVWTRRSDPVTLQPARKLPHLPEKRRYNTKIGVRENGLRYISYSSEPLPEGGIKVKVPFEPVGSLLVFWKAMDRLRRGCGWTLTQDLSLLMDAIEYYLMLAEVTTPADMWSAELRAKRELAGVPSPLPQQPRVANLTNREDQFDSRLYNISMNARHPVREEAQSKTSSPEEDDMLNDSDNITDQNIDVSDCSRDSYETDSSASEDESDVSEDSFVNDYWGGRAPPHDHEEVFDALFAINSRLIGLEEVEDNNFEALKAEYGLSKALSIARRETCQSEGEITASLARQDELIKILFTCRDGNCSYRANMCGLICPITSDDPIGSHVEE